MNKVLLFGKIEGCDVLPWEGRGKGGGGSDVACVFQAEGLKDWMASHDEAACLIWASPCHLLSKVIEEGGDPIGMLGSWVKELGVLPYLVLEYRDRITLVSSSQLHYLKEHENMLHETGLPEGILSVGVEGGSPVDEVLARYLVRETPDAFRLNLELLGLSVSVDELFPSIGELTEELISRYRSTCENQRLLESVEDALGREMRALDEMRAIRCRLQEERDEKELLSLQFLQVQEELEQIFRVKEELEKGFEDLSVEKQGVDERLQDCARQKAVLEGDLSKARSQLDRLKKELDGVHEKHKEQQHRLFSEKQALEKHLQAASKKRKGLEVELAQAKGHLEKLKRELGRTRKEHEEKQRQLLSERNALNKKLQVASQKERGLEAELSKIRGHLGSLKRELEKARGEHEEKQHLLLSEKQRLNKSLRLFERRCKDIENELEETKKRLLEREREFSESHQKIGELSSENELLSLQLHQVQEELEYYFSLYRESSRHMSDSMSVRSVRLLSSHVEGGDETHDLLLEGVAQGEQEWSAINIKLLLRGGFPGVEVRVAEGVHNPISGYRETGRDEYGSYMVIVPEKLEGAALFGELSAQDRERLYWIMHLIEQSAMRRFVSFPDDQGHEEGVCWLLAKRACQVRERMLGSPHLSFSSHELMEYYAIQGWEHLYFELNDVRIKGKCLPCVRFKLAAKSVKEGEFTGHGTLEFRDHGEWPHPLECWPAPFEDDYGSYLHLDCLPELDEEQKKAWSLLSSRDREFIDALMARLPTLVRGIDVGKVEMDRSLDDWLMLVERMWENHFHLGENGNFS